MVARLASAVLAGLVIGIAFMIFFAVATTCAGFVQRPTMKLLVSQSQYIGIGGSMNTKCFHADGSFTVPEERINLTRGSEISLAAWRYSQPDSLELRAESLTQYGDDEFVYHLKKSGNSLQYIVDVPADDYALVVDAEWDDENLPVSRSIYYFRLVVS